MRVRWLIIILACKTWPPLLEKVVYRTALEMGDFEPGATAIRRGQPAPYKELPPDFFTPRRV